MLTWPHSVLGLIEYACNVKIDETTHFRALMLQRLLNGRVMFIIIFNGFVE